MQGQSRMTPVKQHDYELFLRGLWFKWVKAVLSGCNAYKFKEKIIYVDTNTGSGYNDDYDCYGSPVIFCKTAESLGIKYKAYLIEKNTDLADQLKYRVKNYNACVCNDDNRKIVPDILNSIPSNLLGLFYVDPNGIPDWDMITKSSYHKNLKTIDILVRYNSVALLRNQHQGNLIDYLSRIKKGYKFGKEYETYDKSHWSFLLLMNYPFNDWKVQGWKNLNTKNGRNLLDRLSLTKEQNQKKSQLSFIELIENT